MKAIPVEQQKKLLEIINDLLEHPISQLFSIPVDPKLDNVPDYFDKIKNPMDLSTVKTKLIEETYETIDQVKKDVDQIWENSEIYNGRPSFQVFMADRLKHIFNKKFEKKFSNKSHEDWTGQYYRLQTVLYQLFQSQPSPTLSQFNLTPDTDILVPEQSMAPNSLTKDDKDFFARNFKFIDDPATISKIIKILTENEPDIDFSENDLKINLSALNPKTLKLLRGIGTELPNPSHASGYNYFNKT